MSCGVIENGRVIDPANGRDAIGSVYFRDGVIVDGLSAEERAQAEVIDASGGVVCPGLVDIHVHFREPGQTQKETIASGARAAAAGGFTTVVCMPNTAPVADNPGTIQRIQTAARAALVEVLCTGCLTVGMAGEQLAPMGSLRQEGIVAVTDDGKCVQNHELMRRAVEYAHMCGLVVMDHCQDASMTEGAVMNEGAVSTQLGLRGWPAAAENLMIARNIILSELTGAHIHMQHVTSAGGVALLREAQARGLRVTGEVSPHHLYFTDAACAGYDANFKMNPPLRTEADRQALIAGLVDGTLAIIATDHAPHTPDEKDREFDLAPFGVIGLETALGASLEALVEAGHCDLPFLIGAMTHRPAALLGLPAGTLSVGAAANLVIFDPAERWTVEAGALQSKSRNCPWDKRSLPGKIRRTLYQGRTVWDGARIIASDE